MQEWGLRLPDFFQSDVGSVAPLVALAIIPILGAVGAAVDYSRAAVVRSGLQASLDSAVLAGARDGSANWQQTALNFFKANTSAHGVMEDAPNFSVDASGRYTAKLHTKVPTNIVGLLGISTINLEVTSVAAGAGGPTDSCILTLDTGNPVSNVSLSFGGAPNIQLEGCGVRSNTSANCNGHSGGATASYGAGTVDGCSNPRPNARVVPDRFAALSTKISHMCGNLRPGATWRPGQPPAKPNVITVNAGSYLAYHVCGDLTLEGTGILIDTSADSMIIIENGNLIVRQDAAITITRTAVLLTGNNNSASAVVFPNGEGQSATLSLTPPIGEENPWRGISLYQDPILTNKVDNDWGPGATLNADGVVYLPKSNVKMRGIAASANYRCTKIVASTFSTNGSASLDFQHRTDGCRTIDMQRWSDIPVHLAN